jgi:hypothetical protein
VFSGASAPPDHSAPGDGAAIGSAFPSWSRRFMENECISFVAVYGTWTKMPTPILAWRAGKLGTVMMFQPPPCTYNSPSAATTESAKKASTYISAPLVGLVEAKAPVIPKGMPGPVNLRSR